MLLAFILFLVLFYNILLFSENEKALFRRAKAHVGAWNPKDARADFEKLLKINPRMEKSISQELQQIEEMIRQKDAEDRAILAGKMFSSTN